MCVYFGIHGVVKHSLAQVCSIASSTGGQQSLLQPLQLAKEIADPDECQRLKGTSSSVYSDPRIGKFFF